MQITIPREDLMSSLSLLNDIIPTKPVKPILANILVKGHPDQASITLEATNMEMGLRLVLDVENMRDPETMLIPAHDFARIITQEWSENIDISFLDNKISISTAAGNFTLIGAQADDFPAFPEIEVDRTINLDEKTIASVKRKVCFAVATEQNRWALGGVFIKAKDKTIEFVATDVHRLSLLKYKTDTAVDDMEVIVPAKAFSIMEKIFVDEDPGTIGLTSNQLVVRCGRYTFTSRLIDGQFPPYQQAIPSEFTTTVRINREMLTKAVRLSGTVASDETRAVVFSAQPDNQVVISAEEDTGQGNVRLDAAVEGKGFSAAFNFTYLLDLLQVLQGEEVLIKGVDDEHPILVSEGDFSHIIMAMDLRG